MTGDWVLGLDIGTSGAKAIIIDAAGHVHAQSTTLWPLSTPRPGIAEQDAWQYWQGTRDVVRAVLDQVGKGRNRLVGVGLSGQSPGCVMVNAQFEPLRPTHIWMDRRGVREADAIRREVGVQKIHQLSGNGIDPYYGLVKLLWEKREEPDVYNEAAKMLNPKDFVLAHLTGVAATDPSNASLDGIAFDIRHRMWDETTLQMIGIEREKLPDIYPCDEICGYVRRDAAESLGLTEGLPVAAGTVDANAAWIAMGVSQAGDAGITMGTSTCWGVVHDDDVFVPGLISIPHAVRTAGKYVTVGVVATGGALVPWYRENFGWLEEEVAKRFPMLHRSAYEIFDALANDVSPGSEGLVVLPYFMGERNPIWDPKARGTIVGLSLSHTRAHLLRALMEGAAYAVRHNVDTTKEGGVTFHTPISLAEGAAESLLWRRILTDVLGVETVYYSKTLGAPLGAAVIAGLAVGLWKKWDVVRRWMGQGQYLAPNEESHKIYTRYYKVYRALYPALKDFYQDLLATD